MKVLFKLSIISIAAALSANSHAFPELPFCPAGGPPGWMNHFNYKRDQNIWRHYRPVTYYQPYYNPGFRPFYYKPGYYRPGYYAPGSYIRNQ